MPKEDKTDYCGSAGSKFISWIIPDVVFGVDISECCMNHDESWEHGANKTGDKEFMWDIIDKFYIAEKPLWQATLVAHWYYIGVRFGGIFYKLGGK